MFGARELSYENIFSLISPYDVFNYYVYGFEEVNTKFRSELRQDNSPTCSIFRHEDTLLYKDFGTGECFSCVKYVQEKYRLTYREALKVINTDFNLKLGTNFDNLETTTLNYVGIPNKSFDITKVKDSETEIKVLERPWNSLDKLFWKDKYSITVKDLKKYNVMPLQGVWINDNYIKPDSACYGYYIGKKSGIEYWKIYSPFSKNMKWVSNVPKHKVQGDRQLVKEGNVLYITSSLKDVIVLYKLGLHAVAPSSENTIIPKDKLENYRSRFGKLVLFNDNDGPGIRASKELSVVYNCDYTHIPTSYDEKDPSDFIKVHGYERFKTVMGI